MKLISWKIAYFTSLATGLLLIFIGFRFFTVPIQAETDFGIHTGITHHFEFHYIKAIRDLATGLLTIALLLNKEYRSLGWLMLCMSLVPVTDFLLVINNASHPAGAIYPHLAAILICLTLGLYYLSTCKKTIGHAV